LCRIERQIRRGGRCTSRSLADDLEVDPRTIRRYISFLKDELGAPIQWDPIDQRYELTDQTWTMPNVHLSDGELVALAVASRSLAACAPMPFSARLEELLVKLLDALQPEERQEIEDLVRKVDFVPVSVASRGHELVEPLVEAIRKRHTVVMAYYVMYRDLETHRRVDPYHLRYFNGTWYLVAFDHKTGHFPVFNLARVRKLGVTEDVFRPRAFEAAQYFQHTFGITAGGAPRSVRVRLTGRAARTAGERIWPEGFTCTQEADGDWLLSGQVGKLDDLLPWIASWDGDAILLPEKSVGRAKHSKAKQRSRPLLRPTMKSAK